MREQRKISFLKYRVSFAKAKFVAKFQTVEIPAVSGAENYFFNSRGNFLDGKTM